MVNSESGGALRDFLNFPPLKNCLSKPIDLHQITCMLQLSRCGWPKSHLDRHLLQGTRGQQYYKISVYGIKIPKCLKLVLELNRALSLQSVPVPNLYRKFCLILNSIWSCMFINSYLQTNDFVLRPSRRQNGATAHHCLWPVLIVSVTGAVECQSAAMPSRQRQCNIEAITEMQQNTLIKSSQYRCWYKNYLIWQQFQPRNQPGQGINHL